MSGLWLLLIGGAILLSAASSYFTAERKGRGPQAWAVLSLLFYPLILILSVLPRGNYPTRKRWFAVPLQAVASVYAASLWGFSIWTLVQAGSISGVPQCGSETAHSTAIRAFAEAPVGKFLGLKIIDFQNDKQIADKGSIMECTADVTLSNGATVPANYKIETRRGKIFVFIQLVTMTQSESDEPNEPLKTVNQVQLPN